MAFREARRALVVSRQNSLATEDPGPRADRRDLARVAQAGKKAHQLKLREGHRAARSRIRGSAILRVLRAGATSYQTSRS